MGVNIIDSNNTSDPMDIYTGNTKAVMNSFDAMVFWIPHGLIDSSQITEQLLSETVTLAGEPFDVKVVIFVPSPFSITMRTPLKS